jgi:hypothetical protein
MLTVIDKFSRQCLAITVTRRLNSDDVLTGASRNQQNRTRFHLRPSSLDLALQVIDRIFLSF